MFCPVFLKTCYKLFCLLFFYFWWRPGVCIGVGWAAVSQQRPLKLQQLKQFSLFLLYVVLQGQVGSPERRGNSSSKGYLEAQVSSVMLLCHHLGSYSGEGNGNPLQYSCLENLMGRAAWRAYTDPIPWGLKESHMTEWLNTHTPEVVAHVVEIIYPFSSPERAPWERGSEGWTASP